MEIFLFIQYLHESTTKLNRKQRAFKYEICLFPIRKIYDAITHMELTYNFFNVGIIV